MNFINNLASQFSLKKIGQTAQSAYRPVAKAAGDIVSAPTRWAGDALHKGNIINNKDWRNLTDLSNMSGNFTKNVVSLPFQLGSKGGINAFAHNPSSFLVDQDLKDTSAYRNIARPIAKTASNVGIGFLAGGPVGAVVAGVGGALGNHGSLGNAAYNPVTNVVMPAISGYTAGQSATGQAFNGALEAGAGVGDAGLAALDAGTNGAMGASYGTAIGTGADQAATQGVMDMGAQVATDMGATAAPAVTQAAAPTLMDTVGGYASAAGDYLDTGAKYAGDATTALNTYGQIKDTINPQVPQQQQPAPQPNAYQPPRYTTNDLVQVNAQAAANGGYGSAMQQKRDEIMKQLGMA